LASTLTGRPCAFCRHTLATPGPAAVRKPGLLRIKLIVDPQQQRSELVDFLRTVAKPGCSLDDMDDEVNLIWADIIDSFALIQIIFYLEQNYHIDLRKLGIDPADLTSIGGILAAVNRARE